MTANGHFLITVGVVALFLLLKLNVFPRISGGLLPRNFLVVVFCGLVLFNLDVYHRFVEERGDPLLETTPDEKRFEELRKVLPAGGRVGFISDKLRTSRRASLLRYFHTQYALAPIVLVEGTSPDLIIGNFGKFDPESIPEELILVRVFSSGLMLFRKSVP